MSIINNTFSRAVHNVTGQMAGQINRIHSYCFLHGRDEPRLTWLQGDREDDGFFTLCQLAIDVLPSAANQYEQGAIPVLVGARGKHILRTVERELDYMDACHHIGRWELGMHTRSETVRIFAVPVRLFSYHPPDATDPHSPATGRQLVLRALG